MSRVVIYDVAGMTCASCERAVGAALKAIPGVMEVEVSLKQKRAAIRLPDDAPNPDLSAVNASFAGHPYRLYPKGQRPQVCEIEKKDPLAKRLKRALVAIVTVSAVLLFLAPLRNIVPSVSAGASIGALVLLGLVASVSTCLASTGGFLLATTSKNPSKAKTIAVHVGRLATFMLGGAALGALGGSIPQGSSIWYGIFALILGVGFVGVGLNLLELSPSFASMGLRLPGSANRLADRIASSTHSVAPFLVGAVTFVMPCGFTQTAQALALASGSASRGLLLMTAFALGTLPVLGGLTWFGSAGALKHRAFRLAAGSMLLLMGISQLDGGLTVVGSPVTPSSILAAITVRATTAGETVPDANAKEQIVRMTVANGTYSPRNLRVRKGVPIRWEIDGQDVSGCANSIVVPTYRISKILSPGQNIITFTPTTAGTIPFSCGMGMIRGSFTVTE